MTDNMMWIWDNLVDMGITTNEELGLATALCGPTEETLNKVLSIKTGYNSLEQLFEEMEEE